MVERRRFVSIYYRNVLLHTILALSSAILLLLVFPRFDIYWLVVAAPVPLLVALARTAAGWQRAVLGWAAGFLYWWLLCSWIQFVLQNYGGVGYWGSWGCFLLFALYMGAQLALFSWLAGPLLHRVYAIPAVAALWTGMERVREVFGFAWLDLGNAAIHMSLPLRLAPYFGVYGVSFVFAMLATGLACVILRRPRRWLYWLVALVALWLFPRLPEPFPAPRRAVVIQPDIPTNVDWTDLLEQRAERQMGLLSEALHAPLVIWPEMPAPLYYYSDPNFRRLAAQIAADHGYFLFGTVAYTEEHQPLNSAILLGPDGREIGRYDKIHLVPFGEFVPPLFRFVNRITTEAGDFVPGHDIKVLPADGERLGVFICYESAFPDLVRQFAKKRANVLINLSNDGYFGHSDAHEQHLLIARMRAVENRRYLIRATNDGITAVIDPAGRVIKELPSYRALATYVRYGTIEETTFYARHGDWFAWSCLLIGVSLGMFNMRYFRKV